MEDPVEERVDTVDVEVLVDLFDWTVTFLLVLIFSFTFLSITGELLRELWLVSLKTWITLGSGTLVESFSMDCVILMGDLVTSCMIVSCPLRCAVFPIFWSRETVDCMYLKTRPEVDDTFVLVVVVEVATIVVVFIDWVFALWLVFVTGFGKRVALVNVVLVGLSFEGVR